MNTMNGVPRDKERLDLVQGPLECRHANHGIYHEESN